MATRVEIEVEFVRKETIRFDYDSVRDNMSTSDAPTRDIGSFMRLLQYYTHHNKSLVKGEKPRLVSWHFLGSRCTCELYWYDEIPESKHVHQKASDNNDICRKCSCHYAPDEPVEIVDG